MGASRLRKCTEKEERLLHAKLWRERAPSAVTAAAAAAGLPPPPLTEAVATATATAAGCCLGGGKTAVGGLQRTCINRVILR